MEILYGEPMWTGFLRLQLIAEKRQIARWREIQIPIIHFQMPSIGAASRSFEVKGFSPKFSSIVLRTL